MMTIHLNGQAIEVAEGLDLHALLQQLGHTPQAFATWLAAHGYPES